MTEMYRPPWEPDYDSGLYEARHTGTDRAAHHRPDSDGPRCAHCFRSLDGDGKCWRCDPDCVTRPWEPEPITHPRNAQEALLAVQYVEFRALFEDDS